jgi:hypothetical protein
MMADALDVEIVSGDINAPVLDIRIYGTVGIRSIDKVFRWPVPKPIQGNASKISEQLGTNIMADFYKKMSAPLLTECPNCKTCPGCGCAIKSDVVRQPDGSLKCLGCLTVFNYNEAVGAVPLYGSECMVCGFREDLVI